MKAETELVMRMIEDHYPDGVQVVLVSAPNWVELILGEVNPFVSDGPIPMQKVNLHLIEVEPETGIFAAMSPVTHNVYIFVAPRAYG